MIEELISRAPELAGLVIIVVLFLRHLGKAQDRWSDLMSESTKAIRENAEALVSLKVLIEERVPKATNR